MSMPQVFPCRCGHDKADHMQRIGQRGNYTPCAAGGCDCSGYRKRPAPHARKRRRASAAESEHYRRIGARNMADNALHHLRHSRASLRRWLERQVQELDTALDADGY